MIDPHNYSTFARLISVTATVTKAVCLLRNMQSKDSHHASNCVQERQEAEILCVRSAQKTIANLRAMTKQFDLFQDPEGLWRCGGRLSNVEISYAAKCPILLPTSHPITILIVKQAQKWVMDNGVKETLVEVRARHWILKGRSVVRRLIHQCMVCKRFEGLPFKTPPPSPLPPCWVRTNLGVIWQFNVENAPWWGEAFERMVRSTKRCLKKVIGRAHFSQDELTTTLLRLKMY